MVLAFTPQKFRGPINVNTNYPPQRFDESGGTPPPTSVNMLYENSAIMAYEDGILMDYESGSTLPGNMIFNNTGELMLFNNTVEIMEYND